MAAALTLDRTLLRQARNCAARLGMAGCLIDSASSFSLSEPLTNCISSFSRAAELSAASGLSSSSDDSPSEESPSSGPSSSSSSSEESTASGGRSSSSSPSSSSLSSGSGSPLPLPPWGALRPLSLSLVSGICSKSPSEPSPQLEVRVTVTMGLALDVLLKDFGLGGRAELAGCPTESPLARRLALELASANNFSVAASSLR